MTAIHFDSQLDDSARRECLYRGDLFVYSASPASEQFCLFARQMICDAFGEDDPETAQVRLSVDKYVSILGKLKPEFIHHDQSKDFIRKILEEIDCCLHDTYFDVPRLRSSTSDGYLTSGLAYAWHPHRDTWYSSPNTQVNVWLPIFPLAANNTIAFYPRYFSQVVENDSENYNYYQWNQKFRASAARQVHKETRPLPGPTQSVDPGAELRLVCPVGGMILFSGAHLHASVPNNSGVTRFSIDFRTLSIEDTKAGRGAPIADVKCTGSSIRDFLRAGDFAQIDDSVVELFRDGTEGEGQLTFKA